MGSTSGLEAFPWMGLPCAKICLVEWEASTSIEDADPAFGRGGERTEENVAVVAAVDDNDVEEVLLRRPMHSTCIRVAANIRSTIVPPGALHAKVWLDASLPSSMF